MRNIFVSYAHRLDQDAADDFRTKFGLEKGVFSDNSLANVDLGQYSNDYIKNNFIRRRIANSSVTIILIGQETASRWWIDWEIYYSLLKTSGNDRNGILGIYIPNKIHNTPDRLLKNLHMGKIITMPNYKLELESAIEEVYQKRYNQPDLSDLLRVRNSRRS